MGDVEAVIAADIGRMGKQIAAARELLSLMADAGQDTTEPRAELAKLELQRDRWRTALQNRGITVPEE